MDRLIALNSVDFAHRDIPPITGTPQYATDGDPNTATPPTQWPAYQYNDIQDELCAIITAAGIALDRTNTSQVLAAIKLLVQQESGNYSVDTGTANHYIIAPNPAVTALTNGEPFRFLIAHAATGASDLKVSALAAHPIVREDGTPIQAGDMPINAYAEVFYDAVGVQFFLVSVNPNISAVQIQAQAGNGADDTGAANAYVVALTPALVAHTKYIPIRWIAANTNNGASTFNPGPGVKNLVGADGVAFTGGEIVAGGVYESIYDGTAYQVRRVKATTARAGQVVLASDADAVTGTDANKAVTPHALAAALAAMPGIPQQGIVFSLNAGGWTLVSSFPPGALGPTGVRNSQGNVTITLGTQPLNMGGCLTTSSRNTGSGDTEICGPPDSAVPFAASGAYNFIIRDASSKTAEDAKLVTIVFH